jgi:hypothetical protein
MMSAKKWDVAVRGDSFWEEVLAPPRDKAADAGTVRRYRFPSGAYLLAEMLNATGRCNVEPWPAKPDKREPSLIIELSPAGEKKVVGAATVRTCEDAAITPDVTPPSESGAPSLLVFCDAPCGPTGNQSHASTWGNGGCSS